MPAQSITTPTPAETFQCSAGRLRDAEQLVTTTEGQTLDFETADIIAGMLAVVRRDLDRLAASFTPEETPTLTLRLTPQEGAAQHV